MTDSIKVRVRLRGDVAELKSLVVHPMETGARKDPDTGELIPAHHITRLTYTLNGRPVMVIDTSTAVSRDPYFSFSFSGAKAGDELAVKWVDNQGGSDATTIVLD